MVARWLSRILGAVVLLAVLLVGGTALRVWQVARADERDKVDAIIVLGSTQVNGVPKPILQARLEHAKMLYEQGVAAEIMTVGGKQPGDAYTEAQAGTKYLAEQGVPRSALVPVGEGNDTLMSLVAAGKHLHDQGRSSAVLVSDPWHSLRSRTMARDAGISADVSPTHGGPVVQQRSTEIRYIVRETAALLYYRLTRTSADDIGSA
ncbi:YdcF family protein [Sciscionella marina]|uniref:YdcF family protein n=1 Tax=Sciscionella marina TaxID=508770 RepID=UPI00035EA711|nr:YdcF family protein [Sciscionella marina]